MREALNENPIAQIAVLGVLAVIVALLLLTRMSSSSGGGEESASTPTPAIDSTGSTPPAAATDAPSAAGPGEESSTTVPSDGTAVGPVGSDPGANGDFVAGPGLPAPLVEAYKAKKTVVLFVQRRRGIDDEKLRQGVERLGGKDGVALFVTNAGHIARYSRITYGVNVDRVPALIVLQPRHLTKGTPTATLSYGFRGPESVEQAVRDALYKGPSDLPYYPK